LNKDDNIVFIVGSPRSGTTLLGNILDNHELISQWYEPYFIFDKFFRNAEDDVRSSNEATQKVCMQIRKDFKRYGNKKRSRIIVDKSPRNSLKIPFIRKIFPKAKFIHIIRDGRDATLSINKEWIRRRRIVHGAEGFSEFNYLDALKVIKEWLNRQPFWLDRIKALWFEMHGHLINKSKQLNQKRWNGQVGWGPRFNNWSEYLSLNSLLQFNALQWVQCVANVNSNWSLLDENQGIQIQYEELIVNPTEHLENVLHFIDVVPTHEFFNTLPKLKSSNFCKWKNEFSIQEIEGIKPILNPLLKKFGYTKLYPW